LGMSTLLYFFCRDSDCPGSVKAMNQGGALVHIYMDGSVLVAHGGTEMGQGKSICRKRNHWCV
jgi:hypothetical protein